jgi:hypothetical protein
MLDSPCPYPTSKIMCQSEWHVAAGYESYRDLDEEDLAVLYLFPVPYAVDSIGILNGKWNFVRF